MPQYSSRLIYVVLGLILFVNGIRLDDIVHIIVSLVFFGISDTLDYIEQYNTAKSENTAKTDDKTVINLTNRVEALEIQRSFRG
jgi:hypothetical protein